MREKNRAMCYMFICAALWSIGGIFFKLIDASAFVIAGFRSLFAAITVYAYMRVRGERVRLTRNVFVSAVFLCAMFLLFVSANKLTTAANAIVLQYTAPVFILLFSALFLKQKVDLADVLVVLVTLSGIALFFVDRLSAGGLLGNVLAILSGIGLAGMFLSVKHADASERMSGMLMGQVLTAVIGIPCLLFTENHLTGTSVAMLGVLGVVQLGTPYILCALASEHCPPLAGSLIGMCEPLLNPVWVFLFLGEAPGFFALVGGGIVMVSIAFWCLWKDRGLRRLGARNVGI